MSSIMDALRTLQGKRTPAPPSSSLDSTSQSDDSASPLAPASERKVSGPPDVGLAGNAGTSARIEHRATGWAGNRSSLVVGALALGVAVVTVLVVFVFAGGPQGESRPMLAASKQDTPSHDANVPAPTNEAEVADETVEVADETVEVADETAPLAAQVEPGEEAAEEEPATVLANARVLDAAEGFGQPHFGLVEAAAGTAAAPPVRTLTEAEDKANKAAIRSLKVFGVMSDERGIGVYTSEGELRKGCRFSGMTITEVTPQYVVFECGSKRYRWLLPRGRPASKADAS
jgi:hypothetical protein